MELRQLEHFVAAAEELHFTRAAQRVNIVQSGLSSSIGALERELGAKLFVRSTRAVRLTQEGEVLLTQARRILSAADAARSAVAGVTGGMGGRLTIGIMQCFRRGLTEALAAFHAEHPRVELRLVQAPSAELLDRVAAGALDLAFACARTAPVGVHLTPLDDRPMVFACHRGHRLADRAAVSLRETVEEDFVDYPPGWGSRTVLDAVLVEHELRRRLACEVGDSDTLLDLVAHGLGVAVLPPSLATRHHRNLRLIPLAPPIPTFPTAIVTPVGATSTAARILLDTVLARQPAPPTR
ncbi:LysR family transcriptional regulator [Frankia sp. AiPs1]|uniref:LysR family transcriptional regulator n=1 Tax=Frankia sp. AiPs1 TaxID=573493 RepID=UPI0020445257|nr:LysR family transcriptional regulator [Frankia sp. AiPs1]MCM3923391.1 LysR family transcriptional regulator [Frankia sp. AiPs1]